MEQLSFKVAEFEGPLDLLLTLINKNKLNIYDIEISSLLEQYLDAIGQMRRENMDVASEFLEMAARLVYIKTAMLLPKHEEGEELRRELSGQLLEYHLVKYAAGQFEKLYIGNTVFVRQPMEIVLDMRYKGRHTTHELSQAFEVVCGKAGRRLPPNPVVFSGIVARKIVSVSSRMMFLLRRLIRGKKENIHALYGASKSKSELVATFLAILELVKSKRITVQGDFVAIKRGAGEENDGN